MNATLAAYRFATDGGPFDQSLFDGYLHGYLDGLKGDTRWLNATAQRNDYEKAVWCGYHDARLIPAGSSF